MIIERREDEEHINTRSTIIQILKKLYDSYAQKKYSKIAALYGNRNLFSSDHNYLCSKFDLFQENFEKIQKSIRKSLPISDEDLISRFNNGRTQLKNAEFIKALNTFNGLMQKTQNDPRISRKVNVIHKIEEERIVVIKMIRFKYSIIVQEGLIKMELCEIEEKFDNAIDIYNETKDAVVYLSQSSFFCAIKKDTDNLEAEFNRIQKIRYNRFNHYEDQFYERGDFQKALENYEKAIILARTVIPVERKGRMLQLFTERIEEIHQKLQMINT